MLTSEIIFCIGSCTCERSFSALRRLKTWTRSTMKEEWLNGIAVMFVHKHIPVDRKKNLQMWDSTGDRRVELAFNKIDI